MTPRMHVQMQGVLSLEGDAVMIDPGDGMLSLADELRDTFTFPLLSHGRPGRRVRVTFEPVEDEMATDWRCP